MAWNAGSASRSEIDRARPEHNSPLHPRNKEGAEAARAKHQSGEEKREHKKLLRPCRGCRWRFCYRIGMPPRRAVYRTLYRTSANGASVNGPIWDAGIKFDLAERSLVIRHVLLQERHERLGLLRAEINSLKVSQFHLRLRACCMVPKTRKKSQTFTRICTLLE